MKKIFFVIAAVICMLFSSAPAHAQNKYSREELSAVVKDIKKVLPENMASDIIWTDVTLETPTALNFTIKITSENTSKLLKVGLNELTDSELKNAFGKEFNEMIEEVGCPGKMTFVFSDGTKTTRTIRPN